MSGALTRYRVISYVVGVALLVLALVAMPMKYLGGNPSVSKVVAPIHGSLYIVYVVLAYDLARRNRWALGPTVLLLLAGTVPFVSFVAERRVSRMLAATSS